METQQTIDPNRVEAILLACLFTEDEIGNEPVESEDQLPAGAVVVQGVMQRFALHQDRCEEHEAEIIAMLDLLSDDFKRSGGGGMTFLNACQDRNGVLWTGLHIRVDQLLVLGQAIGKVSYPIPRDMWRALPGHLPYIVIDL